MRNMGIQQETVIDLDVEVGDYIRVVSGPWVDTETTIVSINEQKQKVTIDVDMFGRVNSVEIDFADIEKL